MERIDFSLLGDLLRDVVVVRDRVMSILYAEERITESAELARQHECLNASHVALKREGLQVEHQFNVLYPVLRNTARRFRSFKTAFRSEEHTSELQSRLHL